MSSSPVALLLSVPVRPADRHPGRPIGGRDLRYLLTTYLFASGPLTIARLVALVEEDGFVLQGRPSKEVSDALRWEIGRQRVVRLGRGRYAPNTMPITTARRIRRHVLQLHERPPAVPPGWS